MLRFQGTFYPGPGFQLTQFIQTLQKRYPSIGLYRGENRIAVYAPAKVDKQFNRITKADASATEDPTQDSFHFVYYEPEKGKPALDAPPQMMEKIKTLLKNFGAQAIPIAADDEKIWQKYTLWGAAQTVANAGRDQLSRNKWTWDPLQLFPEKRGYVATLINSEYNLNALQDVVHKMLREIRQKYAGGQQGLQSWDLEGVTHIKQEPKQRFKYAS